MYRKILDSILEEFNSDKSRAVELFVDIEYPDYQKNNNAILDLEKQYSLFSPEYVDFLRKYRCFYLGWCVFTLTYANSEEEMDSMIQSNISYIVSSMSVDFSKIFPIGTDLSGEIIFLNNRGQVIKFIGSILTSKPEEWQTYCSEENLKEGLDIAYLDYYDEFAGGYREYRVLGNTFGQFMDECIFGERYLEFSEQDAFYNYIQDLKKRFGIQDAYKLRRLEDGSIHYSMGKQIEDQLKNMPDGALIEDFSVKLVK